MIVEKRLKSIEQLKLEFPYEYDKSGDLGDLAILINTRGINDEMIHKFGDGNIYEFEEFTTKHHFTHRGSLDGWYYHKSWFEDESIDFGIEELFEL